jgi:hypothetical protein
MGMRTALLLAIVADTLQIAFSPSFFEGAASPADEILDLGMAGVLSYLLGSHWEFLPLFLGKLVPRGGSGSFMDVVCCERLPAIEATRRHPGKKCMKYNGETFEVMSESLESAHVLRPWKRGPRRCTGRRAVGV